MNAHEREMLLEVARMWAISDGPTAYIWREAANQLRHAINACTTDDTTRRE